MSLVLLNPPASLAAMMLDSVVTHIGAEQDLSGSPTEALDADYILALTEAAVAWLDGPNGTLGRCLLDQTWRLSIDHHFPPIIHLTLPPVISVESVTYADDNGTERTLAPSAYRVTGLGAWLTEIAPEYGLAWPSVRWQRETIGVAFKAGYGTSAEDVPAPILQAIRLIVAHWFQNREAVNVGNITSEVPFGAKPLLSPFRVFRSPPNA